MKVLFAVSNENISTQIVKQYQKEYKEIISYKNMYYFNAIVKELQRDKSYDRIVISEDLEPFANNNLDAIDKFLFEKLDNISDEATGVDGDDIPIILLSTDRRVKSEPILVKLFGIGIYNALLGQDRSTANVCNLLNKPRSKKEAKIYYKIESDEVNYKSESEENVNEAEIQNIINHYKKLGKDEDRYIESFNNIAAQYNDAQLRIITRFLPLNVKAVLEEKSPKYQSVMTFGDVSSTINTIKKQKEEEGLKIGFLNNVSSNKPVNPVIVPKAVKKVAVKKAVNKTIKKIEENEEENIPKIKEEEKVLPGFDDVLEPISETIQPVKRGRGRPKKIVTEQVEEHTNITKQGRGRPKKVIQQEDDANILPGFSDIELKQKNTLPGFDDVKLEQENILPGFDDIESEQENTLPGFDDIESEKNTLPGFDDIEEENTLPGFDDIESEQENILPGFDAIEEKEDIFPEFNTSINRTEVEEKNINNNYNTNSIVNYNNKMNYSANSNVLGLLTRDKKIVAFVGTTKNGTSFLVNNVAKCLSSMGIKTAILDLTSNRNSYYIYTKNEEQLRNIAYDSIKKLSVGETNGIIVDKNLHVYTALPGDKLTLNNTDEIISTLMQNYSVVLIDCDFDTPAEYFGIAQEMYIVQTMDILTIQPMTAFLRDLKAKDILRPEKIRIVINKAIKVRGLTDKAIIGGLAFYNDPAMSFMTELFDKDTAKYCVVPFETDVYAKYLEGVMDCEISINGYSKQFNSKLKELSNMVYPLLGNKYKAIGQYGSDKKFSDNINNTLEQMKNKY